MADVLLTTYNPLPVTFTHGKGVWLWDDAGNRYLDAHGGIAVCALGHCHPAVTATIQHQATQLLHTSNAYHIRNQIELAERLVALSGMKQAFFANSGAEVNEAAIKLCRLYGHKKGVINPSIIVMENAFHGRTLAMISASGSRKVQAGFEPLVQGFVRAPFNDLAAIHTIAKCRHDIVAVLVEPIQGEGGVQLADPDYLPGLRAICDEHDWLLAIDEVQTGIGRTGVFYAYQHAGIQPDIITTAKALGNGIPIGACLASGPALDLFHPGNHGSTFGGNPFATAVAKTVVDTIVNEGLIAQAAQRGRYLLDNLQQQLAGCEQVVAIRGQGLMIGIELVKPCREVLIMALAKGLLVNVTAERVIRLLPPYIMTTEEADQLIAILVSCIQQFH